MVSILIAGGTGSVGRHITAELVRDGHSVRVLSRSIPDAGSPTRVAGATYFSGDLISGDGVFEALEGVTSIIDSTEGKSSRGRRVLTAGSSNLLRRALEQGVKRATLLSIINVDRCAFGYYQAKAAQENIYLNSDLDVRIVRATQFHQFIPMISRPSARLGIIPAFRGARFQTIATTDVARLVVEAALAESVPTTVITVGGPQVRSARELAETWKSATGRRGRVVTVPLPGPFGKFLREGLNLAPDKAIGEVRFDDWLTETVHQS